MTLHRGEHVRGHPKKTADFVRDPNKTLAADEMGVARARHWQAADMVDEGMFL